MKRIASLLIAFIMLYICTVSCFAAGASDDLEVSVTQEGMPEGTAYIDVLMPKEAFGGHFVDFNEKYQIQSAYRFAAGLTQEPYCSVEILPEDEISLYHVDGWFSFLTHFDGAYTEYGLDYFNNYHDYFYGTDGGDGCSAYFYVSGTADESFNTVEIFGRAKKIMLAYVSETGEILMTTKPFSVRDRLIIARGFESVTINAEKVTVNGYTVPYIIVIYVVVIAAAVILRQRFLKKKTDGSDDADYDEDEEEKPKIKKPKKHSEQEK